MNRLYASGRTGVTVAVCAAIGLLVLAGWTVLNHTSPTTVGSEGVQTHQRAPATAGTSPRPSIARGSDAPAAEQDLKRLRAVEPEYASGAPRRIAGEQAQQPDLYAAEFVRRLLTQDYRSPRQTHLAWVQTESAPTKEPLVVGLVPSELRDRLAVYSVSDAADGASPVPTEQEWRQLAVAGSYTSVHIQHVTEPLAWTNAVADGRITDPSITGREVAALVTRHTKGSRGDHTQRFSVAMTLNLEGPPARTIWGFVAAVTYASIPIGAP
ncbi:hypothetical protein GCM10009867_05000 [Pedococcus aerophilus]|uniref:Uncharacterized protein n=1 Tax=Pedococcus aerophilus TaxID=436356 RepID=A0ABP6GUF3_9MICO